MSQEKSYNQMRQEFQEVFYTKLFPVLESWEVIRKKMFYQAIILTIAGIIASVLLLLIVILQPSNNLAIKKLTGYLCVVLFLFSASIGIVVKKTFENKLKKNIKKDVCKCFGELKWKNNFYNAKNLFYIANLVEKYTDSRFDDVFYGQYKGVNYEIIEAELIRRNVRGKCDQTLFTGCIVKLDMNKRFNGNTVIYPETLMHKSPFKELRYTELEDCVFEKRFDVFTDDEVEARYLITPSFMERLSNLKTAFSAIKIYCSFYDKELLIGLYTEKDLFSIGSLRKPANDPKQFFTLFEQILSIIKLIDYFKLNQKIGL